MVERSAEVLVNTNSTNLRIAIYKTFTLQFRECSLIAVLLSWGAKRCQLNMQANPALLI